MRECRHLPLLLVMFMGYFTSILLGLDSHINQVNVEGLISSDRVSVEDSPSSPPKLEPWRRNNNFHPRDRFRSQKISTMSNTVPRPTIHHSNDWQVLSTISYTIQVGNLVDSEVNSDGCSTSSKLSTCNVRSAWAYCMFLINQQSCGNNAVVNCAMVLPSGTTSMMSGTYRALNLSTLTTWAATCTFTQVSLSVVGSVTGGLVALVQGDGTSSAFIDVENVPFLTLTMSDINVVGFGDGTMTFLSAVVVSALQAAVFQRVSFSNNKGYSTGSAVYATHMGPLLFTACSFINNQQVYLPPLDTPKHSDTDYYDTLLILLTLCIVFTNLYSLLCSS